MQVAKNSCRWTLVGSLISRERWLRVKKERFCFNEGYFLQVDPGLSLIKGGGGALLREKMVPLHQQPSTGNKYFFEEKKLHE